jgi:hypothetical protein
MNPATGTFSAARRWYGIMKMSRIFDFVEPKLKYIWAIANGKTVLYSKCW